MEADRYERTSMLISSNLPFSKWEQIVKDAMTTAVVYENECERFVMRYRIDEIDGSNI